MNSTAEADAEIIETQSYNMRRFLNMTHPKTCRLPGAEVAYLLGLTHEVQYGQADANEVLCEIADALAASYNDALMREQARAAVAPVLSPVKALWRRFARWVGKETGWTVGGLVAVCVGVGVAFVAGSYGVVITFAALMP